MKVLFRHNLPYPDPNTNNLSTIPLDLDLRNWELIKLY